MSATMDQSQVGGPMRISNRSSIEYRHRIVVGAVQNHQLPRSKALRRINCCDALQLRGPVIERTTEISAVAQDAHFAGEAAGGVAAVPAVLAPHGVRGVRPPVVDARLLR